MRGGSRTRLGGFAALILAAIAVIVIVTGSGGSRTLHARFIDAGQLVKGDLVEVGGRSVGTVKDITLSDNNQADVKMSINSDQLGTLHRGTFASVRTVGLVGVANRFVEITPGPQSTPKIPDGGTLGITETKPIVDLDELLTAIDPPSRRRLQSIIRHGAQIYAGSTESTNKAFEYANPATAQLNALSAELVRDTPALQKLISASATTVSALDSRRSEISTGVAGTATVLRAIASERSALGDTLVRAPDVLSRARRTFAITRTTLGQVRPLLRDLAPLAPKVANILREIVPAARKTAPVIAQLRTLLGPLKTALDGFPSVTRVALPSLSATTRAVAAMRPIISGFSPYYEDLIGGFVNGFGGTTAGYYDANGHFARISAQVGTTALTDVLSVIPALTGSQNTGLRTGLTSRCPGSAAAPAPDGSNPYVPDPSLCDSKDNSK